MAIKSLLVSFGDDGGSGKVFLGGTVALNLLGVVSKGGGIPRAWKGKMGDFLSCNSGGSFQLAGQSVIREGFYVKVSGITFTPTEHGSKGPAYWELADNVSRIPKTELAATMRRIIAEPGTRHDNRWVVNLVAAMFLSEVARNPRSFMINLMLLDLIEGGVKYGSQQGKELDFTKLLVFDAEKKNKRSTYNYSSDSATVISSVTVGQNGEKGTVRGGKLPMSHLNAMRHYETSSGSDIDYNQKFDKLTKLSGLNLHAPDAPNTTYHFPNPLLEKECTVLLRWLIARFAKSPPQFQVGKTSQTETLPGVWGKPPSTRVREVPVHASVAITALREQRMDPAWTAAAVTDTQGVAGSLIKAVLKEIQSRQQTQENLLA